MEENDNRITIFEVKITGTETKSSFEGYPKDLEKGLASLFEESPQIFNVFKGALARYMLRRINTEIERKEEKRKEEERKEKENNFKYGTN